MKTWNQLFIRHGWNLEQLSENTFNCEGETKINLEFLFVSLDAHKVNYSFGDNVLMLHSYPISEEDWLKTLSFEYRGSGSLFGSFLVMKSQR